MNEYMLRVYDWNGNLVHIFDSWRSLDYNLKINDNNDLTLTLQDPPTNGVNLEDILVLDYLMQVQRNTGQGWYTEDWFFLRTPERQLQENGTYIWIEYARGLNDLLDRRSTLFAATLYAGGGFNTGLPTSFNPNPKTSKTGPADDVMKAYVEENCGPSATTSNGRFVTGTFPNFRVGANLSAAPQWTGSRTYRNLLNILQEIGKANSVDFYVDYDQSNHLFVFTTAYPQAGRDLTDTLTFRPELGNMSTATHTLSRTEEGTVVLVNGSGTGDERVSVVVQSIARYDSPYNTREVILDERNMTDVAALTSAAQAKLNEVAAQHSLKFTALELPGYRYGVDFKLADRVNVLFKGFQSVQKLVQVHVNIAEGKEQLEFTFGDYMAPVATIVDALKAVIDRLEAQENSGDI